MAVLPFLSVSLLSLFSHVSTQHPPVLDSDGRPLQSNTKYYILPAAAAPARGGLALSIRDRRDPCPPNVMQESDPGSVGLSVELFPTDAEQRSISLSTDVNIAFMAATTCVQRTVWEVGRVDAATGRRYVRMDGILGRPGKATEGNWFKVEDHGGGYKMVYCPTVCSGGGCGVECGDLGVVVESGRRWVGLGGQPLVIVFKKVTV